MSRALWGKARNIVYALRPDILGLAAQGLSVEEIRRQLLPKLADVRERTFRRHASDIIKDNRTLTLKRLLNDQIITPEEFNARVDARVQAPPRPVTTSPARQPKPQDTEPTNEARPPRTGRTVVPGSSLQKSGFNDPELRVASDELLDELYGTATDKTNEEETTE